MATKHDLQMWVIDAINAHDGVATVTEVSKWIWRNRRVELEASGDLLFTWQYDMRWAAHVLRNKGEIAPAAGSKGKWRLPSEQVRPRRRPPLA